MRRGLEPPELHRELERRFSNYRYLALTTREPENLDPQSPGYVGKQHLQDYFASGDFERAAGISLDAAHTHIFLGGNPTMVGLLVRRVGSPPLTEPGMVDILRRRGFRLDTADQPGRLHCETYW